MMPLIRGWFNGHPYIAANASQPSPVPDDTVRLGTHAERLLSDPVLLLAFDRVAEKLTNTWRASDAADMPGRERVYMQLKALEKVKSELHAFLGNKKIIEDETKRAEQKAA